MGLTEIARQVEGVGIEYFELGTLREAYRADHPEDPRKNLTRKFVQHTLREELKRCHCLLWPEEFSRYRATEGVYVIATRSVPGIVAQLLKLDPAPHVAVTLRALLKQAQERESA